MNLGSGLKEAELAILNAPFQQDGWKAALVRVAEQTGSSAAQLLGIGGPMLLPLNVLGGEIRDRHGHFGNRKLHGSCNWRIGTTSRAMEIQCERDYARYRREHVTCDYDDAVSDLDIPFGCQSALLLDTNNMLGLALLRSRGDGPCTADTLSRFALLRWQLQRAVRVQLALDSEASALMVDGVDGLTSATVLIDRHGNSCAMTPAAEAMVENGEPLHLAGLSIQLRNTGENRRLQQALARLIASDGERGTVLHQALVGRSAARPEGWRLFAIRLAAREHGLGFEPHVAVTLKAAA